MHATPYINSSQFTKFAKIFSFQNLVSYGIVMRDKQQRNGDWAPTSALVATAVSSPFVPPINGCLTEVHITT